MISLIYTEISDSFTIYSKKELLIVWVKTFKGLFESELMRRLWTDELKETIDSDSRDFIDEIIYRIENQKTFENFFKDVNGKNGYHCRICKDNTIIPIVVGRPLLGAVPHSVTSIPCPYCKNNSDKPDSNLND